MPRIPDHELLRVIGGGSYGEVWLARNVMGTFRAVKVVYRRTFETARPFEREFGGIQKYEPVSRLHDGLMDILQVGRNDQAGYFYYVMELADPVTPLRSRSQEAAVSAIEKPDQSDTQLLFARQPDFAASYHPRTLASELEQRGRLAFEECLPLFLSLASALGHLHQHGLIHRDIKPSNIIFVNGVAKLADLGLVSEAGQSGSYVGTEGYIPPEGAGTAQADLYSLGKVFYELSTGKDRTEFPTLPIGALAPEEARRVLELNVVFLKACENDLRHRYQTAEEMHAELALLQSGKSVKRLRVMERRLAQATRTGLAAATLFLLAMAAYLFTQHEARRAQQNFKQAQVQQLRAERAEHDAIEKLRDALLAQARAGRRSGQAGQRYESLAAVRQAAAIRPGLELRNEAVACLALADLRPLPTPATSRGQQQYSAFDEALERFVGVQGDGSVSVCRVDDGAELMRLPGRISVGGLYSTFSVDRRWLAVYHRGGALLAWDLQERRMVLEAARDAALLSCAFSPDSQSLVVGYSPGRLVFRDLKSGGMNQTLATTVEHGHVSFSRKGQRIAVWRNSSPRAEILDGRDGRLLKELEHPQGVLALAWSPDGTALATGCLDANAYFWDAETGLKQRVLSGHRGAVAEVVFLDDEQVLASASWDGTLRLWDTHAGQPLVTVAGAGRFPKFNPTTRHLGFEYFDWGQLELYEVLLPSAVRTLAAATPGAPPVLSFVDFSPDGRLLVVCAQDGVRLWDWARNMPVANLPMEWAHTALFTPDGHNLVTAARSGLLRWPILHRAEDEFQLGPPLAAAPALQPPRMFVRAGLSGSEAVFTTIHLGAIEGYRAGTNFIRLAGSEYTTSIAASPNGKWIAAGYWNAPNVRLWDAHTGQMIRQFPSVGSTQVAFSPDSRWLVAGAADQYCLWDAVTGEQGLCIPRAAAGAQWGPIAFRRDSKVMAIARSRWLVQLLETASGRELASLELPDAQGVTWLAFSPSGSHLAVASDVLNVWDLRKLRQELAALNLDWDAPSLPSPTPSPPGAPLQVKVLESE